MVEALRSKLRRGMSSPGWALLVFERCGPVKGELPQVYLYFERK